MDTDTYLNILAPGNSHAERQLTLDRYFDRIMDNSKILKITGMKQTDFMPLEKRLEMEFRAFAKNTVWNDSESYARMDEFLNEKNQHHR